MKAKLVTIASLSVLIIFVLQADGFAQCFRGCHSSDFAHKAQCSQLRTQIDSYDRRLAEINDNISQVDEDIEDIRNQITETTLDAQPIITAYNEANAKAKIAKSAYNEAKRKPRIARTALKRVESNLTSHFRRTPVHIQATQHIDTTKSILEAAKRRALDPFHKTKDYQGAKANMSRIEADLETAKEAVEPPPLPKKKVLIPGRGRRRTKEPPKPNPQFEAQQKVVAKYAQELLVAQQNLKDQEVAILTFDSNVIQHNKEYDAALLVIVDMEKDFSQSMLQRPEFVSARNMLEDVVNQERHKSDEYQVAMVEVKNRKRDRNRIIAIVKQLESRVDGKFSQRAGYEKEYRRKERRLNAAIRRLDKFGG